MRWQAGGPLRAVVLIFVIASTLACVRQGPGPGPEPIPTPVPPAMVTFVNAKREAVFMLTRAGEADDCDQKTTLRRLMLAPGESAQVESGEAPLCWCYSTEERVGSCFVWRTAQPGTTRTINGD